MRKIAPFALLAALVVPAAGGDGQWTAQAPMNQPRQETGAARIGGLVYVAGGLLPGPGIQATATVEAYDIAADDWSFVAPLPVPLDHHAMVACGGLLYAIGGYSGDFTARDEVWIYDPQANAWAAGAPMPAPRGAAWAVEIAGVVYVFGGTGPSGAATATTFAYDPAANTWGQRSSMSVPREHLNAVALGGFAYVIGGRSGGARRANERYDPALDQWRTLAPMPTARSAMAMAAFEGRIFAMGGEIPVLHAVNEGYDPATDTWEVFAPMPVPRHGVAAAALDDRILVPAGGTVQGLGASAHVDAFLPPPPVESYCTPKTNSQGCAPRVTFAGRPSASSPDPFVIGARDVLNHKSGLLFYGFAEAAAPFQGGTLCVQPPIRRTAVQDSGGNPPPDDCSGTYALDFNARIRSGVDPALVAGAAVFAQHWSRDPASAVPTGLTDALRFVVCP